jgi:hypothetical protein
MTHKATHRNEAAHVRGRERGVGSIISWRCGSCDARFELDDTAPQTFRHTARRLD